jgi:uncharacterized protein (TIGR02145 family)
MMEQLIMQLLYKIFKIIFMKIRFLFLTLVLIKLPFYLLAQVMPQGYIIGPKGAIGSQVWALSNLNTSKFANGVAIPYYTSEVTFKGLTTPASCSVNFNSANDAIYGRLYNWYAISDARNVCPVNWHVPTTAEFSTLSNTIGGNGNILKDIGTAYWANALGTDLYDFKAVGTGYMGTTSYSGLGQSTYFWTTNEVSTGSSNAYAWQLLSNQPTFNETIQGKIGGFSVRCIRD